MKALAAVCGLVLTVVGCGPAPAPSRTDVWAGPGSRITALRPKSPPVRQPLSPAIGRTPVPAGRTAVPGRTARPYPPMPRPDVHLRPFSAYSDAQMRRLESWITNNPYWTPQRKQSQIRWWREQNEWMKRQNNAHVGRTFGPWGGGR